MGCGASTNAPHPATGDAPPTVLAAEAPDDPAAAAAAVTVRPIGGKRGSTGGKRGSIVGALPVITKRAPRKEPGALAALSVSGADKPFETAPANKKYVSPVTAVPRRSSLSLPQNRKPSTTEGSGAPSEAGAPLSLIPQARGGTRYNAGGRRTSRGASITEEAGEYDEEGS